VRNSGTVTDNITSKTNIPTNIKRVGGPFSPVLPGAGVGVGVGRGVGVGGIGVAVGATVVVGVLWAATGLELARKKVAARTITAKVRHSNNPILRKLFTRIFTVKH
jgi:hypothetical protein